uniref:RING-type E3 ubiquitin transferase n=1 Tax=Cyprinus carpio TaxID=7962 RepID=A0A8C1W0V6_CYPCA
MEDFPIWTMEMVCLGSSVALSGLFYYIYRKKCKTVDKLKEAPVLPLDEKLADLLNATPGKCLQYVVIEGTVQPIGEPLRSPFHEGTVGVIQTLVLREHKLVWNSSARTWTDSKRVLHQHVNAVPFNLLGVNKAFVRVLCPLEATGPNMEIVHEKFHQANYGFTDLTGQYLCGEKPKGHLETEEMLKVGASLTAVGELILDTDGLPKIRPPTDGSEYFLSTDGFETLRLEQEGKAGVFRVLACVCALAGVALLMWAGRRYYRQLKLWWEQENMRSEFELMGAGEEENGVEVPENVCVICLSNPRGCVLLDCGHVCCCFHCYQALPQPICPICRQNIKCVVPLYQA